ncbi:hypothetical protein ACKWTF_014560 [Chironomus riparius]
MDYWPYFIGPTILIASAGLGTWSRRNFIKYNKNQSQQNAIESTDEQPPQNEAPQSNFAAISSTNRERLQKTNANESLTFDYAPKPQETQKQTIIMMPKEPKIPKQPKMPKPEKAHNFNPKEKLPHFCKAPNDGDMIKRY